MASDPRTRVSPNVRGTSTQQVLELLDSIRPIVRVARGSHPQCQSAAAALVIMTARLFPHTVAEGGQLQSHLWPVTRIDEVTGVVRSSLPVPTKPPERDIVISVGETGFASDLYVGGDDWTAIVGYQAVRADSKGIGLGLHAAAVLAASEIMKIVLGPHGLVHRRIDGTLIWNLLDYRLSQAPIITTSASRPVNVALLGSGSVGSSFAGVIVEATAIRGDIVVVDKDEFDPTRNPFRYPASVGNESGPKSTWIACLLQRAGWNASPVANTVAEWIKTLPTPGFDGLVLSSVDRVDGRLQVADLLARTTLSVGVSDLALHIQREILGDGLACPYCDFVDAGAALGQIERYRAMTGIGDVRLVHLLMGEPLAAQDVQASVAAGKIRPETALELVGRRVDDLVGRSYAEAAVAISSDAPVSVTAPFVSWMGGILMAAEVTKSALGIPMLDRRCDLDLAGLPTGMIYRKPAASARCICASHVRREWMARLYDEAAATTVSSDGFSR
jgi:hypothetical protein